MKRVIFFIIVLTIFIPTYALAENSLNTYETIKEQKSIFKIEEFIQETKEYAPDFLKEMDINNIFNSAIKGKVENVGLIRKIGHLIKSNLLEGLQISIEIFIIVIIHSILKTLTDSLENTEISRIVYFSQYILIITIIMANFSSLLKTINDTINSLIGFSNILIPILSTLMIYTGNIATTTLIEPIILFLITFISNFIKNIILPLVSMITVIAIISKITDQIQIKKISSFLKSSVSWILGITLTVFVGVISLEGTLTSSIDGITAKTTKAAVSNLIPVVRKSHRRWSRSNSWIRSYIKKCSWNVWNNNYNWNMHNSNYKTFNI